MSKQQIQKVRTLEGSSLHDQTLRFPEPIHNGSLQPCNPRHTVPLRPSSPTYKAKLEAADPNSNDCGGRHFLALLLLVRVPVQLVKILELELPLLFGGGGHGVIAYWYGKNAAVALWGSGPSFGMDANMLLAWHKYGGGKELLEEIYGDLNMDVVSFMSGPMPTQPLGWFKKPVTKPEDLKGLKFRTVGLSVDMFTKMGVAVNALPGGEIVPAMDRGLLDAAEFNNASSDRVLGFPDVSKVCMLQSFHQSSEQFEIMFNKTKYNKLPAEIKAIIANAAEASSADMSWKAVDRYSKDYMEMQSKQGVKFFKTPDSILKAQLKAWDEVTKEKAASNPMFKKVFESQRAFAARAAKWQADTSVDFKMAQAFYAQKK